MEQLNIGDTVTFRNEKVVKQYEKSGVPAQGEVIEIKRTWLGNKVYAVQPSGSELVAYFSGSELIKV